MLKEQTPPGFLTLENTSALQGPDLHPQLYWLLHLDLSLHLDLHLHLDLDHHFRKSSQLPCTCPSLSPSHLWSALNLDLSVGGQGLGEVALPAVSLAQCICFYHGSLWNNIHSPWKTRSSS